MLVYSRFLERRREDLEIMFGDDSDEELYDQTGNDRCSNRLRVI